MSRELPDHFVNTVEGYTDLNMLEEAAEECLRMVEADPTNRKFLTYAVGKVSMGTPAQRSKLFPCLDAYLQAHPDDLYVVEYHAALLAVENRHAEALAQFARIPYEKREHDAYWLWFRTLIDAGELAQARDWIRTVWPAYSLKVRSDEFTTYVKFLWDVSWCLFKLEEYTEAEAGFKSVIELDPCALGAYLDLGRLFVRLNRPQEAIPVFKRGLRLTWKEIDQQCSYPGIIGYFPEERRQIEAQIRDELTKLQSSTTKELHEVHPAPR